MNDPDCIFCKVIGHEIPAEFLWEEDETVAFMDINPWTRGHALVIPRDHSTDLLEISADDLAATSAGAQRLARMQKDRLGCDGVNLLNSCGAAGWQTVFHFHIHSIPRYEGDPLELPTRPRPAEQDELARVAAELRG
jgi:histidine triad (HIT) family protein